MANILKFLCIHLLVVCALLEYSNVSSCQVTGDTLCSSFTSSVSREFGLYCPLSGDVNVTTLSNGLTFCTANEIYKELYIGTFSEYNYSRTIEVQLNLSENIFHLFLISQGALIRIKPLKPHNNITRISSIYNISEIRDVVPDNSFPNLKELYVSDENSITTFEDNIFSNLSSLTSLTWNSSSLVNISVDSFKGLNSLSYIDLNDNDIIDIPNTAFRNLPSLEILKVDQISCSCDQDWLSLAKKFYNITVEGFCKDTMINVSSFPAFSHCEETTIQPKSVSKETIIGIETTIILILGICVLILYIITIVICIRYSEIQKKKTQTSEDTLDEDWYKYFQPPLSKSNKDSLQENEYAVIDETMFANIQKLNESVEIA